MRRLSGSAIASGIAAWVALVALVALAAIGGSGCSATKPTELVPGVLTQMQVPRDIDGIEIEVQVNGVRTFCIAQDVNNGTVDLPRTLGVVAGANPNAIVTVIVRAFNDAQTNLATSYGCPAVPLAAGVANGPAIVRRSTQTYVDGHELYLPMPLRFSCLDEACAAEAAATPGHDFTCKGGQCVDVTVSDLAAAQAVSSKLVDFNQSLVDGTDQCFSPSACFPSEVPSILWTAVPVGTTPCVYTLPPGAPPGSGLNVRVFYDQQQWAENPITQEYEHTILSSGEVEILDEDATEGFTLVPNTTPQEFQLAPGLCKLVQQATAPPPPPTVAIGATTFPTSTYVTISDVQVSAICAPKVTLLPICKGESSFNSVNLPDGASSPDGICNVGKPLEPTPSALYAVMDKSSAMGTSTFGPTGTASVLSVSLSDPVFQRTSAAFTFLPHDPNECPGGSNTAAAFTPDIPFGPANTVQQQIAAAISGWVAPDVAPAFQPLDLLAAMRSPNGAYDAVSAVFAGKESPDVAAVMFFVNRLPDPTSGDECPVTSGTTAQAFEAAANAAFAGVGGVSVRTFFVVLGNPLSDPQPDPAPYEFYTQVESEATPGAVTTVDARGSVLSEVLANFAPVITELGTCLYEAPAGVDPTTTTLQIQYSAIPGTVVTIPRDPSCNEGTQSNANGWNFDAKNRLRICGDTNGACSALRDSVVLSSANALMNQMAAPPIPITATVLCSGMTTVVDSHATAGGAVEGEAGTGGIDAGMEDGSLDATMLHDGGGGGGPNDAAASSD
jgi:hypothetical protein